MPNADALPDHLRAVLALFAGELADVQFPDVDRASLERQADEIGAAAGAVDAAREALAAAEAALAGRTNALAETATRGLAYARIYAAARPERQALLAALDDLAAPPRATATSNPPRRRGRPPRVRVESSLFADAEGGAVDAA